MPYNPQLREYYISRCRYYYGEDNCPYSGVEACFWEYEQYWVNWHFEGKIEVLKELVEDYKAYGHGRLQKDDGVPISLKAVLWNRWAKWVGSPSDREGWREFYLHEYLKQ